MQKDFLSVRDLSVYEFGKMLDLADEVKKRPDKYRKALKNRILAMIFQKPSLRTRMTFEAGMLRLGGEAIYLAPSDIQMGSREGAYDIGKNLERTRTKGARANSSETNQSSMPLMYKAGKAKSIYRRKLMLMTPMPMLARALRNHRP